MRGEVLVYSSQAQRPCVGVLPSEREGRLPVPSGQGLESYCCFGLWAEQQCRVPGLLRGPRRGILTRDWIILLGDVNTNVGGISVTSRGVIGMNGLPSLKRVVVYYWTSVLVAYCA